MLVRLDELVAGLDGAAERFRQAVPYPHIVIDRFLRADVQARIAADYPSPDWSGWTDKDKEHQRYKKACGDLLVIPPLLRELIVECWSSGCLRWLERLSGIPDLIPDPHLLGGGLHLTLPGGWLTPHVDFHTGGFGRLYRRLNLIVYLNPGWQEASGGALELWDVDQDRVSQRVLPELGRAVVFSTDSRSMHGFSVPVRGRARRSIALYYYTAQAPEQFGGDRATYWRSQSVKATGIAHAARLLAEQSFLGLARSFSLASWLMAGSVAGSPGEQAR